MKVCVTDTAIYGCKLSVLRAPLDRSSPFAPASAKALSCKCRYGSPGFGATVVPLTTVGRLPCTPRSARHRRALLWQCRPRKTARRLDTSVGYPAPRSTASGPPLHRRSLRSAEYQYRRCSRIFRDGGMKITGGAAKIDVGRDLPNRA